MTQMGAQTKQCLKVAGWTEAFRLDPAPIIETLRSLGMKVFLPQIEFIQRFGNLRLNFPHLLDLSCVDNCHFDATQAAAGVFPEVLKSWEERVGSQLSPIGEAFRDYMTLLMSPEGAVYAAMDDTILRVAGTGEEAIDALCEGRKPEPVK